VSTDFDIWCPECKIAIHLGQMPHRTFAYNRNDREGQEAIWDFISEHASHTTLAVGYDCPDDCTFIYSDCAREPDK
jgi:hypothetical protein